MMMMMMMGMDGREEETRRVCVERLWREKTLYAEEWYVDSFFRCVRVCVCVCGNVEEENVEE